MQQTLVLLHSFLSSSSLCANSGPDMDREEIDEKGHEQVPHFHAIYAALWHIPYLCPFLRRATKIEGLSSLGGA